MVQTEKQGSKDLIFCSLIEGFAKPGFLVKIKARGNLKPQHIEHM